MNIINSYDLSDKLNDILNLNREPVGVNSLVKVKLRG
jgi:hypothetical protein